MERKRFIEPTTRVKARSPRIIVPTYNPPTAAELQRRKKAAEEVLRVRAEIGPIGSSVTDLIREDRDSH